jgi:hypothetical protein
MGFPNGVKEEDEGVETRLDDLWSMRLERSVCLDMKENSTK